MTAVLPDYVCFARSDYSEQFSYDVKQSEMDSGLKKQRPNRSVAIRTRKGSLIINGHENKRLFERWLKSIGGGTGRFRYNDPLAKVSMECRFVNTEWNFSLQGIDIWTVDVEMENIDV